MTITAITEDGDMITIPASPVSMVINKDTDVPADDMTVTFCGTSLPFLARITVISDGKNIFTGIVDKQEFITDSNGNMVKIVARSMAALLTDNEALPENFYNVSDKILYYRYAQSLGIGGFVGNGKAYVGRLNVEKGVTLWQVLDTFCSRKYGVSPRVNEENVLVFNGRLSNAHIIFSNNGSGVPYVSRTAAHNRYNMLSQVMVRLNANTEYNLPIGNMKAEKIGIDRVRYLNVADSTGSKTVFTADQMISNSNKDANVISYCCPQCLALYLGAAVKEPQGDYIVKSIKYVLSPNGSFTYLTLQEVTE